MTRASVQRGVTSVVAMLLVALATSTAAYLLLSESLGLRQVEKLETRAQADTVACQIER
jgi:type II secretory pathway component PulK